MSRQDKAADGWVRLHLWGQAFSPKEGVRRTGLALTACNEPGDLGEIGRFRGQPRPYGSAELFVPEIVPWKQRLQWLADQVVQHRVELRNCGATDMWVDLTVLNSVQGNWEFDTAEIAALASLDLPLAITLSPHGGDDGWKPA